MSQNKTGENIEQGHLYLLCLHAVLSVGSVVESEHDGEADGQRGGPAHEDDDLGGGGVASVLIVEDGRGDGEVSVDADHDQVEDGACAADNVHGEVEIANRVGQVPLSPIRLIKVTEKL